MQMKSPFIGLFYLLMIKFQEIIVDTLKKFLIGLDGVTYNEWIKIRLIMDRSFDTKKEEAAKELRFFFEKDNTNPLR